MSEAVKDLIQQALDQDFNQANKTFQDVITVKMTDVLDQEKIRLADQIYNGVEVNDEDDDDILGDEDGDQLELDLETEDDDEESEEESEDVDTDDDELMRELDDEYELEDEEDE